MDTTLSADAANDTSRTAPPTFKDNSVDCAICLDPLNDRRVIKLGCGHLYHYDCLVQQLRTARPTSTKRLLFTACQCAKCAAICEHPELTHLTRSTDALRHKVDRLVLEQIVLDAPAVWRRCSNDGPAARAKALDDARRRYAFYMCGHCGEPYFGGTVECADTEEDTDEDRLCVACSAESQVCCRNPLEHGGYLTWKCRYCCNPSTHLCYGNVHFCDGCHDRNGIRVRAQQRRRTTGGRNGSAAPPPLEAVPCSGGGCPFPRSDNQSHHSNGASKDNEQVYGCAWCESTSNHRQPTELPGSHNLLTNPSGQHHLQGWRRTSPQISWRIEQSEIPVNETTTTNFVSSYQSCVMSQTLDLSRILQNPCTATLEVSAKYMGRTDCPSVFLLQAVLADSDRRQLQHFTTETLEAPPSHWERASLILDRVSVPHARYLIVTVTGRDTRFWRGNYGSKVADISARVLGSPEQLARVVLLPTRSSAAGIRRTNFLGVFLPFMCAGVLAWFLHG